MSSVDRKTHEVFKKHKGERSNWERIWELAAMYTLPTLYLTSEQREQGIEPTDLVIGDSVGAECFNNFVSLIAKLVFPAGGAFFRVDKKANAELLDKMSETQRQKLYRRAETLAMEQLANRGLNSVKYEFLEQLLGLGNLVYFAPKEAGTRFQVYDLNDVVIKRNQQGMITDVVIREKMKFMYLNKSVKEKVLSKGNKKYKDNHDICFYIHYMYDPDNKKFVMSQSVNEVQLDTADNFEDPLTSQMQIVSINNKKGAHYGVGVVMQYLALLHKASVYSDANADSAVAGSMVNWLVHPNSATRPEEFAQREQGQPFTGKKDDITALTANVGQNLAITQQQYDMIVRTLHRIFLMFTAIQRDAERVTAEEIRAVASRLEEQHSGLYSVISDKLQYPLANLGLQSIEDEEIKQYLPELRIKVVTASEMMSRGAELENLLTALNETSLIGQVPPQVMERLRLSDVTAAIFTNRNVDTDTFIKSDEEFNQEQQQMMEAEQAGTQPQLQQTQVFSPDDALLQRVNAPLI